MIRHAIDERAYDVISVFVKINEDIIDCRD
jgi:hypothetical protein